MYPHLITLLFNCMGAFHISSPNFTYLNVFSQWTYRDTGLGDAILLCCIHVASVAHTEVQHKTKIESMFKGLAQAKIIKKSVILFWLLKELFNCKCKCRPTVAYWVQIDGINIATELITRYYLNGTLIQCCFNLGQRLRRWPNSEPTLNKCTMFERKSSCPSKHKKFV